MAKETIHGPYAFFEAYASDCAGNYSMSTSYLASSVHEPNQPLPAFGSFRRLLKPRSMVPSEGSAAKSIVQTLLPSIIPVSSTIALKPGKSMCFLICWVLFSWSVQRRARADVSFFVFLSIGYVTPSVVHYPCFIKLFYPL